MKLLIMYGSWINHWLEMGYVPRDPSDHKGGAITKYSPIFYVDFHNSVM